MSEAIEDVMLRFVAEVMNSGHFNVLDEIVHPNYIYRNPNEELQGTEALKAFLAAYRAAFPDLQMTIDDMVVVEDKAVNFFTFTGTHEGELMGIPPTGKGVRVHGVVRSRFEDGRIAEEWEILDQLALLTQLGVVSLPA